MVTLNGIWEYFVRLFDNIIYAFTAMVKQFTYRDAIDILLVSFIIYAAVKLIRETRAAQLVKGIVIIGLAYLVSTQFDLLVMSELLNFFFQSAWVALLIVFQPELRSALEKMGRSKVGKTFSLSGLGGVSSYREQLLRQQRKCINAVVTAMVEFQQERIGALIVFERETKLGEIVETGTILNAEPSFAIISNVFYNKAPLHDGAMIVREGMIYAAGCILPLTRGDNVRAELGTRHRAALGMSENSDAVVAVVSEETGQISIAVNGNLKRDFSRETLNDELERLLLNTLDPEDKKAHPSKRRVKTK